jgi:hypothetical protein
VRQQLALTVVGDAHAREPGSRRPQCSSIRRCAIAAPSAPATCGWRSVQSWQGRSSGRRSRRSSPSGLTFVLSLLFQARHGLSALQTGLALPPMTGAILADNLLSGRLIACLGAPPRW